MSAPTLPTRTLWLEHALSLTLPGSLCYSEAPFGVLTLLGECWHDGRRYRVLRLSGKCFHADGSAYQVAYLSEIKAAS